MSVDIFIAAEKKKNEELSANTVTFISYRIDWATVLAESSSFFFFSPSHLHYEDVYRHELGRCRSLPFFLSFYFSRFSFYINMDTTGAAPFSPIESLFYCYVSRFCWSLFSADRCVCACVAGRTGTEEHCLLTYRAVAEKRQVVFTQGILIVARVRQFPELPVTC